MLVPMGALLVYLRTLVQCVWAAIFHDRNPVATLWQPCGFKTETRINIGGIRDQPPFLTIASARNSELKVRHPQDPIISFLNYS